MVVDKIMCAQRATSAPSRETGIIAAIQMCSTNNKIANRELCGRLIAEASRNGAQLVCLPECCSFIGKNSVETIG